MVIDVLLACYNGAAYLPEQLDSLAGQQGADFRVLMQDDGSQDGTGALLAAWAQARPGFRLVDDRSPGRVRGPAGNFWSLLRQAEGEAFAFCDQDDVWRPQRLALGLQALEAAQARYGADTPLLVHSDARVIDAAGRELHPSFFRHQGWDPRATELSRLLVQNNVTGCTVLFNRPLRALALAHGDPAAMGMHDWFLALTAAAFGRVIFLPQPLVDYRQHGDNAVGASAAGLARRGVRALAAWERGRGRIALTYRRAAAFLEAYGDALPAPARATVTAYLALEGRGKPARLWGYWRGNYRMQSPVTRAGQMLFG